MAMMVSQLKALLSGISESIFSITAQQLDVDGITQLFKLYLPDSTLTVSNPLADVEKLKVTGKMTLGSAQNADCCVDFLSDASVTQVAGINIVLTLTSWQLQTNFTSFSGNSMKNFGFTNPQLVLRACDDAACLETPAAELHASLGVKCLAGEKTVDLAAVIPQTGQSGTLCLVQNYVFDVQPQDVSFSGLASLTQFAAGSNFSIIPSEIPVASTLNLTELQYAMDPKGDKLLTLRIDICSPVGLKVIENIFEIPQFMFSFTMSMPGTFTTVYGVVGARIDVYGELIDVSLSIPELYLQGSLYHDTPIPLRPFISNFLPAEIVPDLKLSDITLGLGLTAPHNYNFYIVVTDLWSLPIGSTSFDFDKLAVTMTGQGSTSPGLIINCQFGFAETILYFQAQHPQSQGMDIWEFTGGTADNSSINIGSFISDLGSTFGVDVPAPIKSMELKKLNALFRTGNVKFAFNCQGYFSIETVPVMISVNIDIEEGTGGKYKTLFGGEIKIGSFIFDIVFNSSDLNAQTFIATYSHKPGDPDSTSIHDLVAAISPDLASIIPPSLQIDLKDVIFAFLQQGQTKQFVLGMDLSASVSLSDIPLIGPKLPSDITVSVDNLQIAYSSAAFTAAQVSTLNSLLPSTVIPFSSVGITQSLNISAIMKLGDEKIHFDVPAEDSSSTVKANAVKINANTTALQPIASPYAANNTNTSPGTPPTIWFNVQKTFGPVTFEKVGVRYSDGNLYILMDSSLTAGGLTIGVIGLGLGSSMSRFDPVFNIDGLDVTFHSGPLTVSGGLMGTISPVNFTGELIISFPPLTIAALGAYSEVEGHPSFFMYAVLEYPFGGPPFFFVTGLAAGMGYNRKLITPDINGVATFPLVEWAMGTNSPGMNPQGDIGKQVQQVLTTLSTKGVVAPSVGEDWLAFGIRFTSFQLVDSFALLTVSFGTDFEIDLLGLSRLSIPTRVENPVALAELQLKASFSTKTGLLAIAAQLSPNSYVLSKDCHLTGGFAFYIWFSGEHAGDFVVTLGGYCSKYTVPSYYPQVPRLGLNWQITNNLSIKGGLYFALTSNAVMAGGSLSCTWQCGCLKAWFDAQADFLMVFKPFHYYISIGVDLGASVRLNLLFTHVTITIHVGVGLELWGPEFSGKLKVDLYIVSFTISFGAANKDTSTTIAWSDFVSELLPSNTPATQNTSAMAAADGEDVSQPAVTNISISKGLLKQLSDKEGELNFIVSGQDFEATTNSAIPSKDFTFSSNIQLAPDSMQPQQQGQVITPNNDFGVGPTGTDSSSFYSTHAITVQSNEDSGFRAVRVLQNIPKALWQKKDFDSHGVPKNCDPVNDTTIPNVLTGYKIVPYVSAPDHTLPIDIEYLRYTIDENIQYFTWSKPSYPIDDSFSSETVSATIQGSMAQSNRSHILTAIQKYSVPIGSNVDVSTLADEAQNYLLASPALRLLGEQKNS